MGLGRFGSIVFYCLIAFVTCAMAFRVRSVGNCTPQYGFQCSLQYKLHQTRESFYNRLLLIGIFSILVLCSALRFDIGNDYRQYTQTAHEAYVGGYVVTELGFNGIVKLIYSLFGTECYEAVFALFAFITIVIFLKAMVWQSVDFAQSYFLFMTLGLYFQTYNTIRYYLALAIALYAMRYVLRRDWIPFIFWILAAALFHKSVLLVLPVYWLASKKKKKIHIVIGLIFSAICYVGQKLILKIALVFYPSYRNTIYLEGGNNISSALRVAAVLALYIWFIYYTKKQEAKAAITISRSREIQFYGQLQLLAFAACTFFSFLPVVTRIAYYFSVSQVLLIPLLLSQVQEANIRKRVKMVVFAVYLINFGIFLWNAQQEGVGLLPYRSWLFTQERYIYK